MILDFSFKQVMKLSSIQRWAIIEMARPQSVAEHSYNVAMISLSMLDRMELEFPGAYSEEYRSVVMKWALCHDLTEIVTGDFPSSLKSYFGKDISAMEKSKFPAHAALKDMVSQQDMPFRIVKAADYIDAIYFASRFCVDEGKAKIIGDMRERLYRMVFGGPNKNANDVLEELIIGIWPDIWNV